MDSEVECRHWTLDCANRAMTGYGVSSIIKGTSNILVSPELHTSLEEYRLREAIHPQSCCSNVLQPPVISRRMSNCPGHEDQITEEI